MLLIEGSDCLGKTILAKKIVRKISDMSLPVTYGWMTRPNEDVFDFFLDYKKLLNPYAVQDRFHISGLAYHDDKISVECLQIINGWIRGVGGIIVVLYAEDENWYRERLENDERGNILPVDKLCAANKFYKRFSTKGSTDLDYAFNILPEICYDEFNGKPNFVSDFDARELIIDWLKRRRSLGL